MDNFQQYSIELYLYSVSVVDSPLLSPDMPAATINFIGKEKETKIVNIRIASVYKVGNVYK